MISFFLILAIVGGVENGAPLSNIFYAFLIVGIDVILFMLINRIRNIKR